MHELSFATGEVIYREGDSGDAVYVVQSGAVEVSRMVGSEVACLSVFGPGEIFGETGVIRDKPHSTTVTALSDTVLLEVDKATFLKTFGEDNPFGLPLLRMLCSRLAATDERMLAIRADSRAVAPGLDAVQLRLLPASNYVVKQIGEEGVAITDCPFVVGRRKKEGHGSLLEKHRLALFDGEGNSLSAEHFAVEEQAGQLVLRDLGSRMGTVLNGAYLSRFAHPEGLPLRIGVNEIIAGTKESDFRFRLVAEDRWED